MRNSLSLNGYWSVCYCKFNDAKHEQVGKTIIYIFMVEHTLKKGHLRRPSKNIRANQVNINPQDPLIGKSNVTKVKRQFTDKLHAKWLRRGYICGSDLAMAK